jgi:hypothetical protein
MANKRKAAAEVGVNVRIPVNVHRAAKLECVARGVTWDEAAAEAFGAWAKSRRSVQQEGGR